MPAWAWAITGIAGGFLVAWIALGALILRAFKDFWR